MKSLIEFAGKWRGTSTLHLPEVEPDASESELTITPVVGGRFLRLDYTWAQRGKAQEGSLLMGVDAACWVDTWHMSNKMMICALQGEFSYLGSFAVPPGPDWGWRINLVPELPERLRIVMTNIAPGEDGDLAVDAVYSRIP